MWEWTLTSLEITVMNRDFYMKVILHTVADVYESYRFLLVYHSIFNIITDKQLDYILLFTIILKYL